jgi:hypothetical protein
MKNLHFRGFSACFMLASGVGLSIAGFCVPPVGEISSSFLLKMVSFLFYDEKPCREARLFLFPNSLIPVPD